jgi:oligopeptide transport system substrate-binding protein
MKCKWIKKAGVTALATTMLAGCGSSSAAVSTASSGEDTQNLNLRVTAFGTNFDVQDMGWRWMMADCYEGLYRNVTGDDGTEEYVLAGAESVDISEDNLTYTFHLREDAKWSDGVAVTAHDYEYAWKRLENPEYAYDYASFLFNVVGAEEYYEGTGSADDMKATALDDYTFQVVLKKADPTFLSKLVATPTYPTREDLAEAAGDDWASDWTVHVYNGPFCMTELVEDNKMVWTKNDQYWDADNVKLDTVTWYDIAEDATAATMFENNELDVLQTSGDYAVKYDEEVDNGNLQKSVLDYPGTYMLCFDLSGQSKSGLMDNVNIRKAISYSINREEMVESVYGRYNAAHALIAPAILFDGTSWRDQVEEPDLDEYNEYVGNSEKIQELFQQGLDELGVTTPISEITLTFLSYGSTTENQNEREYIQQSIQNNIGCQVELNTVGDYTMFASERDDHNFDIMVSAWYSDYNDPLDYLTIFHTGEYPGSYGFYSDAEYDSLYDSLDGESDMTKRKEIYTEMETMLMDDCVFIPIYYSTRVSYLHNWVKDYHTSAFGASQELYRCYIDGRGN